MQRRQLKASDLLSDIPLLILDALADWPAATQWTPATLATLSAGTVDLKASFDSFRLDPNGLPVDPKNQFTVSNIGFGRAAMEILANENSKTKYYISQQSIVERIPEVLKDVKFVWPEKSTQINLWFGSAGVITPLHYDSIPNLFAQVYGRKRFTLFAPEESSLLYPYPEGTKMAHLSFVDVERPDLSIHPLFECARRSVFTIVPGQMLFLPPFWYHHVESLDTSISVNQWTLLGPELRQCRGPMALRWGRARFKKDRWKSFCEEALLSKRDLLAGFEILLETNPGLAALVALVIVESDQQSAECVEQELSTLLEQLAMKIVGSPANGELIPEEQLQSVLTKKLPLLRSLVDATAEEAERVSRLGLQVGEENA